MTDTKKIELAVSDLAAAVAEHAEYRAAKIVNERMETWHNVMQGLVQKDADLAQRVQKLENAGSQDTNEKLHAAHRRIADLEIRIEDLERDLGYANNEAIDLEARLEKQIDDAHRLISGLLQSAEDLEKQLRESDDDTRTIIADMINDGDIRLHVD